MATRGVDESGPTPCPVLAWAASGCMALTGWPTGPPLAPAGDPIGAVGDVVDRIADRSGAAGLRVEVDVAEALSGRAAWAGLERAGRTSAGGSCRLVAADDAWVAVNLARPDDVESLGAVLGGPVGPDPWAALAAFAATSSSASLVEGAQLVGIPAGAVPAPSATLPDPEPGHRPGVRVGERGRPGRPRPIDELTVVDLSSLWAGPLCARVLGLAGARVVKVESAARPDRGRTGNPAFFAWLHHGHRQVVIDFGSADGRRELADLLASADVVIEASRPRALEQLGLGPASPTASDGPEGQTWLSITGYGRASDRVAFGDDAAAAGGLVAHDGSGPVFAGDALADPLSGLAGAAAVLDSVAAGGGRLLDLSLCHVAREAAARPAPSPCGVPDHPTVRGPTGRWQVRCGDHQVEVAPPRIPSGDWVAAAGCSG